MGSYVSSTTPNYNKYNWKPDVYDSRDRLFSGFPRINDAGISVFDEIRKIPVYDQGDLGSCTANALAGALQFDELLQGCEDQSTPSRLFVYYNERAMEGTVNEDAGAAIRDGVKSLNTQGYCDEKDWPYDISKFTEKPPESCYDEAKRDTVLEYYRVDQTLQGFREALQAGFPIVFGFRVYESIESDEVKKTGDVPMPQPGEALLGGHAIVMVGIDEDRQRVIFRNSWGDWAPESKYCVGYGSLPIEYVTNPQLASDFWVLKKVTTL